MSVSDILRYLQPQECDMTTSLVPTGDAYCETPFWFVAPFQMERNAVFWLEVSGNKNETLFPPIQVHEHPVKDTLRMPPDQWFSKQKMHQN